MPDTDFCALFGLEMSAYFKRFVSEVPKAVCLDQYVGDVSADGYEGDRDAPDFEIRKPVPVMCPREIGAF